MASGTLPLEYSNTYFRGQIVWSSTVSGGTSTVYAELQVRKNDGATTTGTFSYEFYLGTESDTGTWYRALGTSWTTVTSLSYTTSSSSCYIYGYVHGPSGTSLASASVSLETTLTLDSIYTLTISRGTGTSITVRRTSSPVGGSTGTLSNGSKIYKNDVLTVTFSASTGYTLKTHTVAGTTFTSGGSYTVSGNITVAATATLNTYKLTVTSDDNISVTVYDEISGNTYSNGDYISHFSTITISYSVSNGYEMSSFTVNGTSYTDGVSLEVSSAITVVATSKALGLVYIFNGSSFEAYQVYIYDGSSWNLYCPYVYDGSSWSMCA